MQSGEYNINAAEGIRLMSDIRLGEQLFPRGHVLTAEDIIIFKMYGVRHIFGAIMDDFDVDAPTAAGIIAAKLCGKNTAFRISSDGHCHIVALSEGVLMTSAERLSKFNRLHQGIILNTLEPYSLVTPNQVIAELEILQPVLPQAEIDDILFKLSGNSSLIEVAFTEARRAALIYAKFQEDASETAHFTEVVKKLITSTTGLGLDFDTEYHTSYTIDDVADEIERSIRAGHEINFIIPALPTSGEKDVIPEALNKIVDEIACCRLPILSTPDFMAAQKRNAKIIVLPYNYDKADSQLIERTIKQVIFSEKLQTQDYSHLSIPSLQKTEKLPEEEQRTLIMPKNYGSSGKKANIAAVILAAGQGRRAGRNKLMVDVGNGVPLFMKAVNAAIGSNASPVFVVTGHNDLEMQEFLDEVDVNVVYNPAYHAGVRTSIELGLKSVPNFCDGVMLIPADMPNLTAADLNKLIAKFKPNDNRQVVMFAHKGIKSNPVIWGRDLYNRADVVPENAQQRPVFLEHSDYTTLVDIKDKNKLLDVTFPSDVDAVAAKE